MLAGKTIKTVNFEYERAEFTMTDGTIVVVDNYYGRVQLLVNHERLDYLVEGEST